MIGTLRELERAMWTAATRGDPDWMDRHLTPDFAEFGRSGRRYERDSILAVDVPSFTAELSPIDVSALAADIALLTYRSALTIGDDPTECANRSSVWVRRNGSWLMRFHQGTPCDDWRQAGPLDTAHLDGTVSTPRANSASRRPEARPRTN